MKTVDVPPGYSGITPDRSELTLALRITLESVEGGEGGPKPGLSLEVVQKGSQWSPSLRHNSSYIWSVITSKRRRQ